LSVSEMALLDTQGEQDVLGRAESVAGRDQWKEAAALLQDYHEHTALSVRALGTLAYYYSRAGNYDRAITVYQRLLQQQPSQARWLYALGFQYQQTKRWPEAIAAYEQSRQLVPCWLLPTLRLGDTYQASGQTNKALYDFWLKTMHRSALIRGLSNRPLRRAGDAHSHSGHD
jgi:tetratricopeptide (TPR) repeat protein